MVRARRSAAAQAKPGTGIPLSPQLIERSYEVRRSPVPNLMRLVNKIGYD